MMGKTMKENGEEYQGKPIPADFTTPSDNPDSWMMSQEEADKAGMGEMHKRMTGGEASSRSFPKTDADWINLAEDIKDKVGENSPDYYEANQQLGAIIGLEGGNLGYAKDWLVRKAGELNIS